MVNNYDNWEKLVRSALDREKLKQLALCSSLCSSSNSSTSSSFDHGSDSMIVELVHWLNEELQSCNSSSSIEDINQTRRKKITIGARKLMIEWGENPIYWNWTSDPDSRFSEVAELKRVCWLDIICKIDTRMLSRKTRYGAYLVFKLAEKNYGLGSVNGVVRFVKYGVKVGAEKRASVLHLDQVAVRREDGWMEIELGNFFNDEGEDGEIEARMMEIHSGHMKSGIIIEAIEFRPNKSYDHVHQRLKLIIGNESSQELGFGYNPGEPKHRSGSAADENQRSSGDYDHEWGSPVFCWNPAGLSIQFRRPGTSHHDRTQQTGQQQSNFIIGARELMIEWGDNPTYWEWTSHPDSRFSKVARLKRVCWLDIKCNIETRMLSHKTTYGAYLVFKLAENNYGLESVNGVVRFVEYESAVLFT